MRTCAKMRCGEEAAATVALRLGDRVVWIRHLSPQRDPNLLDLCAGHADSLVPPLGWQRADERAVAVPEG